MQNNKKICWLLGIPDKQVQAVHRAIKDMETIELRVLKEIPNAVRFEKDAPFLMFTSKDIEKQLRTGNKQAYFEILPHVIILPEKYTFDDLTVAIDAGATEIIKPPLSKKRLQRSVLKALEADNIHNDIQCMTREILLERELLERKNSILSFMVNFMTNVSQSMSYETIFRNAFTSLTELIPAKTMHVAFWKANKPDKKEVTLCIDGDKNATFFEEWKSLLLKEVSEQIGKSEFTIITHSLSLGESSYSERPQQGRYLSLPITNGQKKSGILLLVGEVKNTLGKDQIEALEVTLRLLGLVLSNAEQYKVAKSESEIDMLTGLFNRRFFERQLQMEMERFKRYKQPMSLMIIDIDHFKSVNDQWGHNAGDKVLQEISKIMQNTLRATDYIARFGGEEFCAIMPETTMEQATIIAERLRLNIDNHTFFVDTKMQPLHITVSIGLSFLDRMDIKTRPKLIEEADTSLYQAKNNGRNCIVASPYPCIAASNQ